MAHLLAALAIAGLLAASWSPAAGLSFAPAPGAPRVPFLLQSAPFSLDRKTVLLCAFDGAAACASPGGPALPLKTTFTFAGSGMFGTPAAAVPASGAVGIYPGAGFSAQQGTVEVWAAPAGVNGHRQYLFSLEGRKSLNGDPFNDLIVGEATASPSPSTSFIYFGNGNSVDLAAPAGFASQVPRGISVGDVDGDRVPDLVVSMNAADEVWVFPGPFQPGQSYPAPSNGHRISVPGPQGNVLADLDRDGDLDLLVASYNPTTAPIYGFENDGAGHFTPLIFSFGPFAAPAEGIDVGDVNQDGVLDVLFGSFTADQLKPSIIFLGQVVGAYTIGFSQGYIALDNLTLGVSFGDVNGDGWLDAALARQPLGEVALWLNDGTGQFPNDPQHRIPLSTPSPFTVSAKRDVNNDGWLDIAVANWLNGGDTPASVVLLGPLFAQALSYPVSSAVSFTIGDLTNDGIADYFAHASTGTQSPLHALDIDGNIVSTAMIPTQPTCPLPKPGTCNPSGPGSGVHTALKGTTPYGTIVDRSNSMELFFDPADRKVHFVLWDDGNVRHEVGAPFPATGFTHVQAEWNLDSHGAGKLRLFVGDPNAGGAKAEHSAGPILFGEAGPLLRIGTGPENQYPWNGTLDEFRISSVERSAQAPAFRL